MHEITQQRLDESDLVVAKTFQSVGISKNTSIVFVTMLQADNPKITQRDISNMSGLSQGVVSKAVNELVNRDWVMLMDAKPSEPIGRPTHIYKAVSISIIVKDMLEYLAEYMGMVKADIAKIKEIYK